MRIGSLFALVVVLAGVCSGQHATTAISNPFDTPEERRRGEALYRSQCASCHGVDGKGSAGVANLAGGIFKHGGSDEGLYRSISQGIAGTTMPAFKLSGREVWQVVGYVRSLSRSAPVVGNRVRGEQVVAASGCLNCHAVGNKGAVVGVDLVMAAGSLQPGDLREAIVDPSARVSPEHWRWRARLKDGTEVSGSRLNEDTYSVQILDSNGRLRTIQKDSAASYNLDRTSPMPSFRDKLSAEQLNDVIAYLISLKGEAR